MGAVVIVMVSSVDLVHWVAPVFGAAVSLCCCVPRLAMTIALRRVGLHSTGITWQLWCAGTRQAQGKTDVQF